MDGDVVVQIEWPTVNYKDGLTVAGKAPVVLHANRHHRRAIGA
jgi:hypothetical protein